jgi:hypothetical protein
VAAFHGKPPGGSAGKCRTRPVAGPAIAARPAQVAEARRLRRLGAEPEQIASALSVATEEVEKALVQMRSPRPETNAALSTSRLPHTRSSWRSGATTSQSGRQSTGSWASCCSCGPRKPHRGPALIGPAPRHKPLSPLCSERRELRPSARERGA